MPDVIREVAVPPAVEQTELRFAGVFQHKRGRLFVTPNRRAFLGDGGRSGHDGQTENRGARGSRARPQDDTRGRVSPHEINAHRHAFDRQDHDCRNPVDRMPKMDLTQRREGRVGRQQHRQEWPQPTSRCGGIRPQQSEHCRHCDEPTDLLRHKPEVVQEAAQRLVAVLVRHDRFARLPGMQTADLGSDDCVVGQHHHQRDRCRGPDVPAFQHSPLSSRRQQDAEHRQQIDRVKPSQRRARRGHRSKEHVSPP